MIEEFDEQTKGLDKRNNKALTEFLCKLADEEKSSTKAGSSTGSEKL